MSNSDQPQTLLSHAELLELKRWNTPTYCPKAVKKAKPEFLQGL